MKTSETASAPSTRDQSRDWGLPPGTRPRQPARDCAKARKRQAAEKETRARASWGAAPSAGSGGGEGKHGGSVSNQGIIEGISDAARVRDLILRRLRGSRTAGLGDEVHEHEAPGAPAWTAEHLAVLRGIRAEQLTNLTIAYEPVWAIGTGKVATPEDAAATHKTLRTAILDLYDPDVAATVRIQYGGSVKAKDAPGLFSRPEIDGGLIGGASLDAQQFLAIVRAACEAADMTHKA